MKNIYAKLHKAWPECGYVQKTGQMRDNNGRVQYNYATAENIVDAVRSALHSAGLISTVSTESLQELSGYQSRSGASWFRFLVTIKITIGDPESGESVSGSFSGVGQDAGDKALPKAYTMALKYGLRQLMLIETGEDDTDKTTPEPPATPIMRPQVKRTLTKDEMGKRMLDMPDEIKNYVKSQGATIKSFKDAAEFYEKHDWNVDKLTAFVKSQEFGAELAKEALT